jgi:photosystem II stability/assembly factor-like uncharacterized protein
MKRCLLLLFVFILNGYSQMKWQPLTGTPYNFVSHLAVNASGDIFAGEKGAGTRMGIYKKSQDSAYFKPSGMQYLYVTYLFAHRSGNIIAGTSNLGIYYSTDNGATWKNSTPNAGAVTAISENSYGDLIALIGNKMYISVDNGINWINNGSFSYLLSNERNGLLYGVWGSSLICSSDHGNLWFSVSPIVGTNSICNSIYVADNGYIYITFLNNGVLRSTNSGNSFQNITEGLGTNETNCVSGIDGGDILVSNPYGIFSSSNYGDSWQVSLCDSGRNFLSLVKSPQGFLYSTSRYGGIYLTSDGGASWHDVSLGLPKQAADQIVTHPSGWLFASFPTFGVWGSSDNGVSWVKRDYGLVQSSLYSTPTKPVQKE